VPPEGTSSEGGGGGARSTKAPIACGSARCAGEREVCCLFSHEGVCVPATTGPEAERWPAQAGRCEQANPSDVSLTGMRSCDDSGDCGADARCCSEAIGSDLGYDTCAPKSDSCSFGEPCADDAAETCRAAGAVCIAGRCRKGPVRDCAGSACTAAAPLCCGAFGSDAPACRDADACASEDRTVQYECTRSSDCPPDERCQAQMMGTRCQGSFDSVNARLVCEKDADCTADVCALMAPGTRARCTPEKDAARPWLKLKVCSCG
jgi:hypothetical protein